MKRILSVLILLAMLLLVFFSCNASVSKDTESTDLTEGQTWGTRETYIIMCPMGEYLDWGALDFEDLEINALIRREARAACEWSAETTGSDELDDAIADIKSRAESTLSLKLKTHTVLGGAVARGSAIMEAVREDALNGLGKYDIVADYGFSAMAPQYAELWADLKDEDVFPHFKFDFPCWNRSLIENAAIADKLYVITGEMNISTTDSLAVIWYNMDLYEDIVKGGFPEDLQYAAIDGAWTYELMNRLTQYANAEHKDSVRSMVINGRSAVVGNIKYATETKLVEHRNYGTLSFNVKANAGFEQALDSVRQLYSAGAMADMNAFADGDVLFYSDYVYVSNAAKAALQNMSDRYTMLPWPEYDMTVGYRASADVGRSVIMSVPASAVKETGGKGDAISAYLEYVNEETYVKIRSVYYKARVQPKNWGISSYTDITDLYTASLFNAVLDGLDFDFVQIYDGMLEGVFTKIWTENAIDEQGVPLERSASDVFGEERDKYEAALESLTEWLEFAK